MVLRKNDAFSCHYLGICGEFASCLSILPSISLSPPHQSPHTPFPIPSPYPTLSIVDILTPAPSMNPTASPTPRSLSPPSHSHILSSHLLLFLCSIADSILHLPESQQYSPLARIVSTTTTSEKANLRSDSASHPAHRVPTPLPPPYKYRHRPKSFSRFETCEKRKNHWTTLVDERRSFASRCSSEWSDAGGLVVFGTRSCCVAGGGEDN